MSEKTDDALAKILNKFSEITDSLASKGVDVAGQIAQAEALGELIYPLTGIALSVIAAVLCWIAYGYIPAWTTDQRSHDPTGMQTVSTIVCIILLFMAFIFGVMGLAMAGDKWANPALWKAARNPQFALARRLLKALE